jgi:hypothetical protein
MRLTADGEHHQMVSQAKNKGWNHDCSQTCWESAVSEERPREEPNRGEGGRVGDGKDGWDDGCDTEESDLCAESLEGTS